MLKKEITVEEAKAVLAKAAEEERARREKDHLDAHPAHKTLKAASDVVKGRVGTLPEFALGKPKPEKEEEAK